MIGCYITSVQLRKNGKTQAYTCSAVTKDGLDELWDVIQEFAEQGKENGVFLKRVKNNPSVGYVI